MQVTHVMSYAENRAALSELSHILTFKYIVQGGEESQDCPLNVSVSPCQEPGPWLTYHMTLHPQVTTSHHLGPAVRQSPSPVALCCLQACSQGNALCTDKQHYYWEAPNSKAQLQSLGEGSSY